MSESTAATESVTEKPKGYVAPAEPEQRAQAARSLLGETSPTGASNATASSGTAEGGPASPRDPADDAKACGTVLEAVLRVAARVFALKWNSVGRAVDQHAQVIAAGVAPFIGPAAGLRFPTALSVAAVIASIANTILRTHPIPVEAKAEDHQAEQQQAQAARPASAPTTPSLEAIVKGEA